MVRCVAVMKFQMHKVTIHHLPNRGTSKDAFVAKIDEDVELRPRQNVAELYRLVNIHDCINIV